MNKTIKSFSKARSRFSVQNKRLLSAADKNIFYQEENFKDFKNLLKVEEKNILEIGFGDGKHLYQQAELNLDVFFLGVEVFESGLTNTYRRIIKNELKNLKLIQGDIAEIINLNKSLEIFTKIYVLFPDPWPKSKHKKRRLLKKQFILGLKNLLKENGKLIIKTDWEDYAEEIKTNLNETGLEFKFNEGENFFKTKYEEIAIKEKRKIFNFEITIDA